MCLSVDEWRSQFPSSADSEQRQFAHDLVAHITDLHEAGKLTADFLHIAVRSLDQSVRLEGDFLASAMKALKCLEVQGLPAA